MARKNPTDNEPAPDFEGSLEELEALVERLERGDLQLDEALRSFERGVLLTRQCQTALSAAQQRVEILLKQNGGTQLREFTDGSEPLAERDDE